MHPISAFVGPNGGGKSLAMVTSLVPHLLAGRPVVSTVPILDPVTGGPHPLYTPLTSYAQLLDLEHCHVLLDEVTGVASSRSSSSMPDVIANWLVQLRRRDVVCWWTSPDWRRADTIIREVTQTVTFCRGYFGVRVEGSEWKSHRLFRWLTFDAYAFTEFTAGSRQRIRPLKSRFYWRPRHDDDAYYDTLGGVDQLGHVTDGGVCVQCGGRRQRARCECPSASHSTGQRDPGARRPAKPASTPRPSARSRAWSVDLHGS